MKRYSAYKPSGVEWIGDIPEKWEIKRGKFVFALLAGFPADSDLFTDDESCMPLIRIRDINNASTEIFYKGKYPNLYIVNTNDVLIGMDGDFNIAKWQGRKALLNQRVCRIIDSPKLDTNFAYYLLSQPLRLINDVTYATTVKHLSTNDLMNCLLPIPPLSEQVAIAAYLDSKCAKIDNVLSVQQKRIELLKELKQSIITNAVTKGLDKNVEFKPSGIEWIGDIPENWTIKKIKHLFRVYAGATPETKNESYWDGDVVWVTPADYKTIDKIILEGSRNITREGLNSCNTQLVPKGSLIFSKRAPIGTVAISGVELCTNQGCLSCVPKNVNSTFFYYVMSVFTDVFDMLGSGATFKEISVDSFVNVKLPVPSSLEQKIIASYLEKKCSAIDNQISKIERQIELLKEYKQSIITECVTGKRKVC